jgi:hypothetical protein
LSWLTWLFEFGAWDFSGAWNLDAWSFFLSLGAFAGVCTKSWLTLQLSGINDTALACRISLSSGFFVASVLRRLNGPQNPGFAVPASNVLSSVVVERWRFGFC